MLLGWRIATALRVNPDLACCASDVPFRHASELALHLGTRDKKVYEFGTEIPA